MNYRFIWLCLTILLSTATFGQITVKGTVKDKDALPIPGANVAVKGTATAVSTDFDGKYAIVIPNKDKAIIRRFLMRFRIPIIRKTKARLPQRIGYPVFMIWFRV